MSIHDSLLLIHADAVDDFERVRIATENRLRSLVDFKELEGSPEAARLEATIDALHSLEHQAILDLQRAVKNHPLGLWVKATKGLGLKQTGRLIASIGDPYWNLAADGPRTVSQLWAYCGYHVLHPGQMAPGTQLISAGVDPSVSTGQKALDAHICSVGADTSCDPDHARFGAQTPPVGVAPSRAKGRKANWSANAKMRAYLCAEKAVIVGVRKTDEVDDTNGYDVAHRTAISPLGQVYLDGRAKYADAVHGADCKRCGPAGKPALAGSELSEGHKHARALRIVAKEILKLLWREARRLHLLSHPDQIDLDAQHNRVGVGPSVSDDQSCVDTQPHNVVAGTSPLRGSISGAAPTVTPSHGDPSVSDDLGSADTHSTPVVADTPVGTH